MAVGGVTFRVAVAGRSRSLDVRGLERHAAVTGLVGGALILPAAVARLFVQVDGMRFPDDPWSGVASRLLRLTTWGHLWVAQVAIAVLLIAAFTTAARSARRGWQSAAILSMALAITPSLASHAMSAHTSRILSVGADSLHIVGAGVWLGTLLVLCLVLPRALREQPSNDASPSAALVLVSAFSPVALLGAGVVVVSGIVSSLARIDRLDALRSPYGRLLLIKVAIVAVVALIGWRNWKRLTPRLESGDATALRRSIALELTAAALVLAATAALVVTPPPMEGL